MPRDVQDSLTRMRSWALEFPQQLRQGFDSGRSAHRWDPGTIGQFLVVGMGGSAIAGDFLKVLAERETSLSVEISRAPDLRKGIAPNTLFIAVSYSGDTWETVSAFVEASGRSLARLAVCSRGQLARLAESNSIPRIPVPTGYPPRAAVGYLLGGLLAAADPWFPHSLYPRLDDLSTGLDAMGRSLSDSKGEAAQLARRIGRRPVGILTDGFLAPVGRRAKNQIEENSKRSARLEVAPEALHNAIEAWSAEPRRSAAGQAWLLLRHSNESERVRRGLDHLGRLLRRRGFVAHEQRFDRRDPLENLLRGVVFVDHLSLWLAQLARVDPEQMSAITAAKRSLASAGGEKS